MNSKLAIQLAGQIRDWDIAFPHWEAVKKRFNETGIEVDFFISTWSRSGEKNYYKKSTGHLVELDSLFFTRSRLDDQDQLGEEYTMSSSRHICHHWGKSSLIRMNYELESNIKYDAVLISRPDLLFRDADIDTFTSIINEKGPSTTLDPRGVYTRQGTYAKHIPDRANRGHLYSDDMWAFGHRVSMNSFVLVDGLYDELLIENSNHVFILDFLHKMNLYNWQIQNVRYSKNSLARDHREQGQH